MTKPTLYQFEISPFCDKVRRVLHLKGVAYDIVEVPLIKLGSLKKITPTAKLPALRIGDEVLADSTDIVRAIDARWPDPPIYPADPVERARAHVLEDWADESLYWFEVVMRLTWADSSRKWALKIAENDPAPVRALAPHLVPLRAGQNARAQGIGRRSREQILEELERHVAAVDTLVGAGGGYLVGGGLSIADLAVFVQLFCVAGTAEGGLLLDRHPGVVDWMTRVEKQSDAPARQAAE